jgi:hypothetical protein
MDWAKENPTTEEIKIALLLATDDKARNAWHEAAKQGNMVASLLLPGYTEMSVWHRAINCWDLELFLDVWE